MSLQDEHLQQALKHAPDRDLAPNNATRAAVLTYAANALASRQATWRNRINSWMHEWFGSSWHSVGLGSAVATVLIVVVFWHDQPDDIIWKAANPTEESVISASDSAAVRTPQGASAEKPSESVVTQADSAQKPSVKMAERQVNTVPSQEKSAPTASPVVIANKRQATVKGRELAEVTPAESEALPALAAAPAPSVSATISQNESVVASNAKAKLAKEDIASKKSSARLESFGADLPKSVAKVTVLEALAARIKNEGGKVVANQDIQADNLRLLRFEVQTRDSVTLSCPEMASKAIAIDALTGYNIETFGLCDAPTSLQSEFEIYNQTMRDWHSSHAKSELP